METSHWTKMNKRAKEHTIRSCFHVCCYLKAILCNNNSIILPNSCPAVNQFRCNCRWQYIDQTRKHEKQENTKKIAWQNKNTLTGPVKCQTSLDIMPTYHYVENQGKLIMQSQENGEKPQFGQFFDDFDVKYLQIANFSEKQVSFKLKVIFSTNFRPKTKKIVRTVFEKNISV